VTVAVLVVGVLGAFGIYTWGWHNTKASKPTPLVTPRERAQLERATSIFVAVASNTPLSFTRVELARRCQQMTDLVRKKPFAEVQGNTILAHVQAFAGAAQSAERKVLRTPRARLLPTIKVCFRKLNAASIAAIG